MGNRSAYRSLFFFLLFFLILDRVVVDGLFRITPLASAWGEKPFYTFHWNRLHTPTKTPDEFRIVIAGSSIASYGLLPELLEKELNRVQKPGEKNIRVFLFSHQGMNPTHLFLQSDRLLSLEPDLVILPINMVDFRLERPLVLGLFDGLVTGERSRALETLRGDLLRLDDYLPMAPGPYLRFFYSDLDWDERARVLLLSAIQSYGRRDLLQTAAGSLYNRYMTSGRSYHHYGGLDPLEGGVSHTGWSSREFSFPLNGVLQEKGLLLQVGDTLIQEGDGKSPILRIHGGRCDSPSPDGPQKSVALKPGWQRISLNEFPVDGPVCFRSSKDFDSAERGFRVSFRLAGNTGFDPTRSLDRERPFRLEDQEFSTMDPVRYRESFEKRLWSFDRPGMEYLKMLLEAKKAWGGSGRTFDEGLPAATDLVRFSSLLREKGVPLLLYNAPENPITLGLYRDSVWYETYLKYLNNLPSLVSPEGKGGAIPDDSSSLPSTDFYDYHHLTYGGARSMTGKMALRIRSLLDQGRGE